MIVIPAEAGIHCTASLPVEAAKIGEIAYRSETCSTVDPGLCREDVDSIFAARDCEHQLDDSLFRGGMTT
jgi:hypothetical protein